MHLTLRSRAVRSAVTAAFLAFIAVATTGCASSPRDRASSPLPAATTSFPPAQTTLVWVGQGRASVFVDGAWRRVPAHDYEFSVTQRRYPDRWESVKVQHRRHPDYDGTAGGRDQVHYFRIALPPAGSGSEVRFGLQSSFGDGTGTIDREFRSGTMEFGAEHVSRFAPFDRYRITQQYRYEAGELRETVDLFRRGDGRETAFMRFEESAALFAPHRFPEPPDRH